MARGKPRRGASRVRAVPAASRGGARRVSVAGDRLDLPCTPGGTADVRSNDPGRRADGRTRQVRALASPDGGSTAPGGAGSRATVAEAPRSPALCAHRRDRYHCGGSARGVRSRWKRRPRGRLGGRRLAGRRRRALGSPGRGHRRRRYTHGRRSRRRGVLGHERRRSLGVADRPRNERRPRRRFRSATARAGSRPAPARCGWSTASTAPSRGSTPARTPSSRRSASGVNRSGSSTRPARSGSRTPVTARSRGSTPSSGKPHRDAPGRRHRARVRRRHAVGERACRGPVGSHRPGDREAGRVRSRSGTARRGSLSATARRMWRTPWTGMSHGSIPTRTRSPRPSPPGTGQTRWRSTLAASG